MASDTPLIRCDRILTNAHVLTMDSAFRVHRGAAIAVSGSQIVGVGPTAEGFEATEEYDCCGRVVMPGLVNAHTHAAMALLRGLADDLRLDIWLHGYMMPVEREFVRPDFVRLGTALACAEMIRSGITCFADMYYFEEVVAEAANAAGLRAVCGQTVLKFLAPDATTFENSLARGREFIRKWKDHDLIVPALAPHAPYTCTAEILRACADLALEMDVPLLTHLSETAGEVQNSLSTNGMSIVPWVEAQGLLGARVLAAHCVHVDDGEIRTLSNARTGVAHNPTSNLKLGSGIAPIARMLNAGVKVGIGTDGPASNNDLDMFEEVRLATLLAKGSTGDPTAVPARDALAMATRLGAEALHLGSMTGSLEVCKRADLIVVDLATLHNSPTFARDPNAVYSQIVYAAKASDVIDVMCNGRWLMRDRRLLTVEETELARAAGEWARRIDSFVIECEKTPLNKLVALHEAAEVESLEVQLKARLASADDVLAGLGNLATVIRSSRHRQLDTYLHFHDPKHGHLRYREDEVLDEKGGFVSVSAQLTLTKESQKQRHNSAIVLYRTRHVAAATHSLRFYREYFGPRTERQVEKTRRCFVLAYRGTELNLHLDLLTVPRQGWFLELKSGTWSEQDAEHKAAVMADLLRDLGVSSHAIVEHSYVDLSCPGFSGDPPIPPVW